MGSNNYKKSLQRNTHTHIERAKNLLGALAFTLIHLDNKQISKDKEKINIKHLIKEIELFWLKQLSIIHLLKNLFPDKLKFKQIVDDLTPTRLATLQRYLKQLNKRRELDDNTFNKIWPQSARIAWAHGLPKMHKHFDNIQPILTNSRHHWNNTLLSWKILIWTVKSIETMNTHLEILLIWLTRLTVYSH